MKARKERKMAEEGRDGRCGDVAPDGAVCVLRKDHGSALHFDGRKGVWRRPPRQYVPCRAGAPWCVLEDRHDREHEVPSEMERALPLALAFGVVQEVHARSVGAERRGEASDAQEKKEGAGPGPAYTRSSGQCVCEACGREYWRHPHAEEWVDWQGEPWLRRLCDGRLVKL